MHCRWLVMLILVAGCGDEICVRHSDCAAAEAVERRRAPNNVITIASFATGRCIADIAFSSQLTSTRRSGYRKKTLFFGPVTNGADRELCAGGFPCAAGL